MFRKTAKQVGFLPSAFVLAVIGLAAFSATSHAAVAVTGEDVSILDLARPIYDALASHQYSLTAMLVIVLLVALTKRYLGDKVPWLHSDAGGSALVLVGTMASAMAAGLLAPGATITWMLLKTAALTGVSAAGGYAMIKNLLITPFLKPLAAKAPAWLQPIFNLVFAFFDHPPLAPVAIAIKAGDAAVAAAPATGADGIVGTSTEVK